MPDENGKATESELAYIKGVNAGCSGCLVVMIGAVTGLIGGFIIGDYAFDWYYSDENVEPLGNFAWVSYGGMIGLFAGVILALIGWGTTTKLPKND